MTGLFHSDDRATYLERTPLIGQSRVTTFVAIAIGSLALSIFLAFFVLLIVIDGVAGSVGSIASLIK